VAERDAADWRVRVLLARLDIGRSDYQAAYRSLLEAARIHPQSLTVQQELWKLMLGNRVDRRNIQEYLDLSRGVNEFADPFICSTCRNRSLEFVWRCPQCFEWDTFTEERPAWQ
jgi:lipopolysaccharide biosynthesis regulator YciM